MPTERDEIQKIDGLPIQAETLRIFGDPIPTALLMVAGHVNQAIAEKDGRLRDLQGHMTNALDEVVSLRDINRKLGKERDKLESMLKETQDGHRTNIRAAAAILILSLASLTFAMLMS